ncbi:unnamed protein product [Rotaria sordida]|uniref:Uncharacterized protein n=1 Tax=Rotaria sordida TaxID=392033 RepID=A0A819MU97_9BILA|nr:unnamed protein product [Rotaria sordida]
MKTLTYFLNQFQLIRTTIQLNQFITADSNNAVLRRTLSNLIDSHRFVSNNEWDNTCSCGTNGSCMVSEGVFCRSYGTCFLFSSKPNQTIPGLFVSCLLVESILASSLECFYNTSCIQMLIDWYPFDRTETTLDPRVLNVTALDSTINSRFSPDTKLDIIVSQLFLEYWINSTNFSSYYNQCEPDQCFYTYEERFNRAYIIATLLGIVGGLSIVLRILIPPIVILLRRMYRQCRRFQTNVRREMIVEIDIRQKITLYLIRFQQFIRTINFYRKVKNTHSQEIVQTTDEISIIQRQQIATRLYIILFIVAIVIIVTFTGLNSPIQSIKVSSPTKLIFEQLQFQYSSSSLSCPCSQISVQHSKFISIKPTAYHQVCSSYFISSNFIQLLWDSESFESYYYDVDMKILSLHFNLLSSFCSLAKIMIEQKIEIFYSQQFISVELLTRHSFQIQIDSIIENFIYQVPINFRQIHNYIIDMFHANQLHNLFLTNWNLHLSSPAEYYLMRTDPITYNTTNISCSCAAMSTCSRSILTRYNKTVVLPGLVIGCLPIYGLRLSTLECLYDSICLQKLSNFSNMIYNIPSFLNISMYSRFYPISSVLVGTLIDELFIEGWQHETNYSSYFSICAPSMCLYGGLTVGLKIFIWHSLHACLHVRKWLIFRRRRIAPNHTS